MGEAPTLPGICAKFSSPYKLLLIEIFTNLIDNSIKYSDKNKEIIITAKKDGEFNTVSVADQGIGIPKESIHRITERFFTVDPSKSRSVGGTGLGLAIVKTFSLTT